MRTGSVGELNWSLVQEVEAGSLNHSVFDSVEMVVRGKISYIGMVQEELYEHE